MNTKINNKDKIRKTRIIYSMRIAMELIQMGHIVLTTIPNPEEPKYTSWIFAVDDSFERDLEILKGGARIV